jgi:hypothetical protein
MAAPALPLAPAATHLSRVHVLALHACIAQDADVILDTKVKQGPRLATSLVDDQLIEGEVVRQDQILLREQQGHQQLKLSTTFAAAACARASRVHMQLVKV